MEHIVRLESPDSRIRAEKGLAGGVSGRRFIRERRAFADGWKTELLLLKRSDQLVGEAKSQMKARYHLPANTKQCSAIA